MIHITAPKSTTVAAYPNVGLYAFGKIASISGNTVVLKKEITTSNGDDFTLTSDLLSTYYVQVITVPNFNTLTVNSGITVTPLAWNTSTGGGIVAFRAKGNCTINGKILTHSYGAIRYDLHQMKNSKLIDRFLCAKGGGIFVACGGTFKTTSNARLGASWSGLGEGANGAAGYGGHANKDISSYTPQYVGEGFGGRGAYITTSGTVYCASTYTAPGDSPSNTPTSTTAANSYGANGGGGSGTNGGNCAAKGVAARYKVAGSGGGIQGGSGGSGGSTNGYNYTVAGNNAVGVNGGNSATFVGTNLTIYGGAGGGAAGGNGGGASSSSGIAGACCIFIANRASIAQASILTGGGTYKYYNAGGGTGFCYIAAGELV